MKKWFTSALFLFLQTYFIHSQDSGHFKLSGYVTNLQSVMLDSLSGPFLIENQLHNRLNFKYFVNKTITLTAELRNRIFTGDLVSTGEFYASLIGKDPGLLDLSWNVAKEHSFIVNATLDRLYLEVQAGQFQITAGRQRINWGQTFIWNPNDIFNVYSFFDFDYAEKPGSDAIRLQYFTSPSSAAELAFKSDNRKKLTAAGLYRWSFREYDVQCLAGILNSEELVIGTGWSGAIGTVSFRGEASWFEPYANRKWHRGTGMITTGFDKTMKDNSLAQCQVMYCNHPLKSDDFTSFYTGTLSPRDLAFSRFSAFGQYAWAMTSLTNLSFSILWFPDLEGYFAGSSFDWSLAENLDVTLLWQHFDTVLSGTRSKINLGFLRIRYCFQTGK